MMIEDIPLAIRVLLLLLCWAGLWNVGRWVDRKLSEAESLRAIARLNRHV